MNQHALPRSGLLPVSAFLGATALFVYLGFEFAQRGAVWFALAGFCLACGLGLGLRHFFPRWTTEGRRRELAALLAGSGRWAGYEPRQTAAAVEWVLERSGKLSLDVIQNELRCLELLWCHLHRYAKYLPGRDRHLQAEALLAELLAELDRALAGTLLGEQDLGELAAKVLVEISRPWIRAAAGGESVRAMEVDCLTLVVLGIFTAETAPGGLPLLAHLAPRVAHQPMALRMLFGCLWKTVPGSEGAGASADPSRLAVAWDEWATAAEAEMGGGLSDAVHGELRAQLLHRVWPTWLPMASTINQGARQSEQVVERLDELSQAAVARSPRQHAGSTETTRSGLR